MSKSIILTSDGQTDTSDFTVRFRRPIELGGLQYECALIRFDSFYSYYNISSEKKNNIFLYNNGNDDIGIHIPNGLYSMPNLIRQIHLSMKMQGDYTMEYGQPVFSINFIPNIATGHIDMVLTDGFSVNFEDNEIRHLFGFDSKIYTVSSTSERKTDINNGVSKVFIHCDLVSGASTINGSSSDVIYSFSTGLQENEEIRIENTGSNYLMMYEKNQIDSIRIYLTDQRERRLHFNNAPVSVELHIRPLIMEY